MGVLIIILASSSVGFQRDRSIQARDAFHCNLVQMGSDPFSLWVCELKGRYLLLHPCMMIGHHYHAIFTFTYISDHIEPEQPKPRSGSYSSTVSNTGPPSVDGRPRYDAPSDHFGLIFWVYGYYLQLQSCPDLDLEYFNRDPERLVKELAGKTGLHYPTNGPWYECGTLGQYIGSTSHDSPQGAPREAVVGTTGRFSY